jgi:selenocysteine-specific elongation factor
VAADDGVMPQTLEHLAILDLLGIRQGVVALTKTDRVDAPRLEDAKREIITVLGQSLLEGAPVFPVSSATGDGIDALRDHIGQAARKISARPPSGNFRLAVDRSFSLRGVGVTVTGTVFSGAVSIGDALILSPSGIHVRVRGIHANNQVAEHACAGQRCAVNIAASGGDNLGLEHIQRGDWLMADATHAPTARLDARIRLLRSETGPLKHWTPVHVHAGAAHITGRIALLEGAKLEPGASGLAQLVLDCPIGALRGDRVILRDASARRTIGGGSIIDPFAPGKGRARQDRIAILHALETPAPEAAMRELLALSPGGVDLEKFILTCNLTGEEAAELWQTIPMRIAGRHRDQTGVSDAHYAALLARIPQAVGAWHEKFPQSLGPNELELRRALPASPAPALLNAALKQLVQTEIIRRSGTLLHMPEHRITPAAADARDWESILPLFDSAGLTPPRIRELAIAAAKPPESMETLLERLAAAGMLTRVSKNRFFTPECLRAHAALVEQAAGASAIFTAQQYRLLSGIGRNLTIEILEFFDRTGFTRRIGDGRILRAAAADIFGQA